VTYEITSAACHFRDIDQWGTKTYEAPDFGSAVFYMVEGSYGEEFGGRTSYGVAGGYPEAVAYRDRLIAEKAGPSRPTASPYTHWRICRNQPYRALYDIDGSEVVVEPDASQST
jgi:hypothetical protein